MLRGIFMKLQSNSNNDFKTSDYLIRSMNGRDVSFYNDFLEYESKIPEYTEFFQIYLNNKNITEKYYRFLQQNKVTQKNWRYNKSKNHFSIGTNSPIAVFNCLDDQLLINFIKNNK